MKLIGHSTSDRKEWLHARRSGVGASDAPKILGLSSLGGPLQVYASKVAGDETTDSDAMRWGRLLEQLILSRTPEEVPAIATYARSEELFQSDAIPWQMATFDGFVVETRDVESWSWEELPVEGKFVPYRESHWDDGLPPEHLCQLQHQMSVSGASAGYLIALVGARYLWKRIARDDRFIDEIMLPAEERFWNRVLHNDPPDAPASAQTNAAIKRLWKEDDGQEIELSALDHAMVVTLEGLRKERKRAEDAILGVDDLLRRHMGTAQRGKLPDGRVLTLKTQQNAGYMVEAFTSRPMRIRRA